MPNLYGAIEAGGTKFVCAVGSGPDDIIETRIPTTTPQSTFAQVTEFFSPYRDALTAIGIGSFGPLDRNPDSPNYGFITSTTKAGWLDTDFVGAMTQHFNVPVVFETDVNAAAVGEGHWGAARGNSDFIYLTVGTGIGGGVVSGGNLIHGLIHTELGHIFLPKHPRDKFAGQCPYHANLCLEGLASGPAIHARWGKPAQQLEPEHPAWDMQAYYLACALNTFICSYSPQKIILGGGVMQQAHLLEMVKHQTLSLHNGYIGHRILANNIDNVIVAPGLKAKSGILGALYLAKQHGKQK